MEMKKIQKKLTAPYYIRQNLELVLGSERRTLDYRLATLIKNGCLERLKPGFFLNKSLLDQTSNKNAMLEYVGGVLKFPSYVSLEYALAQYGVIPDSIYVLTYITSKKTAEYHSINISYRYRNIQDTFYTDYEPRQFEGKTYYFAKKWKALFDFLYLIPLRTSRDYQNILFQSRIQWSAFTKEELAQFVRYCLNSQSKKMAMVTKVLLREGVL